MKVFINDDNYCSIHQIAKKWLLTSSYCPACEVELHGSKGRVSPLNLGNDADEKTVPLGDVDFQILDLDDLVKSSIRQQWEAKYGEFICMDFSRITFSGTVYSCQCRPFSSIPFKSVDVTVLIASGYPEWPFDGWHDSIAKVWPIK